MYTFEKTEQCRGQGFSLASLLECTLGKSNPEGFTLQLKFLYIYIKPGLWRLLIAILAGVGKNLVFAKRETNRNVLNWEGKGEHKVRPCTKEY
ncbi:MAG: hypothetical protein EDM77_10020 [Candidatus Jettenia sp. AMX1]|nr:MAG: hypothetical protein EDM77_10020 [Candidatus Jettenia sp. AMX1]MCE7881892.1 hypothetical protein [Candidatus Jettenia sp. AMX1]MCQ3927042.1 hypothetical protein [Candidatus Jettenia sp.]